MHVHSENSHDSTTPVVETAKFCIEKQIKAYKTQKTTSRSGIKFKVNPGIRPKGEDTHSLRLVSKLTDLREEYANWILRAKLVKPSENLE